LLFSCNQKEKQIEKSEQSRVDKVEGIKAKYGVKYSMTELLDFDYSYQFNPVLKEKKQLFEHYIIHDICTKCNQNIVKLSSYKYYFNLIVEDESILKTLLEDDDIKGYYESEDFLIIQLDEIKKMDFIVDLYEDSFEDEVDFFIEIIENEKFIGKGKILKLIKR
jgi:hypothetical protein